MFYLICENLIWKLINTLSLYPFTNLYSVQQRYIYRIDPTRMNEFGFSQEMIEEVSKKPGQEALGISPSEGTVPVAEEAQEPNQTPKSAQEKKTD